MSFRLRSQPWTAPQWVPAAVKRPSSRCVLANVPTPIERWSLKDFGDGKQQFFIKRDDLTGTSLTGNKVRKLEFLLADAIEQGCDSIIAWGASTSNHCRSTAVACAELGLECHLLLTSKEPEITYASGNITLAALSGAHMYRMEACAFDEADRRMKKLSARLAESGKKAYVIPRGGSNSVAAWSYIAAWEEMMNQPLFAEITDIVVVSGSGGTGVDLALANYWSKSKKRIHGFRIWGTNADFYHHANETLKNLKLDLNIEDLIHVTDSYVGNGYAETWPELKELILNVAETTGIFLDTVYTGKALYGIREEIKLNPGRFAGDKILFIHTGGLFGVTDGSLTNDIIVKRRIEPFPSELTTYPG